MVTVTSDLFIINIWVRKSWQLVCACVWWTTCDLQRAPLLEWTAAIKQIHQSTWRLFNSVENYNRITCHTLVWLASQGSLGRCCISWTGSDYGIPVAGYWKNNKNTVSQNKIYSILKVEFRKGRRIKKTKYIWKKVVKMSVSLVLQFFCFTSLCDKNITVCVMDAIHERDRTCFCITITH